jgi:hypothetical protein
LKDTSVSSEIFTFNEVPQQARARWFIKRGDTVEFSRGFSSKGAASEWIANLGRRLDWRAGFVFRLRGDNVDMFIVDRDGVTAKP